MLALLSLAASGGCSRGSAKVAPPGEAEAAATVASSTASMGSEVSTPLGLPRASPAVFSAPIAATRVHHEVVVASKAGSKAPWRPT